MFGKEKETTEKKLICKALILQKFKNVYQFSVEIGLNPYQVSRFFNRNSESGTASEREIISVMSNYGVNYHSTLDELRKQLKGIK